MVFAGHSNVVQITKIKVIKLLCCLRLYQNFLDRPRRILMDTWHARDQGVGVALLLPAHILTVGRTGRTLPR